MHTLSVDQAISIGKRKILLPCILFIIIPPIFIYVFLGSRWGIMIAPMLFLLGAGIAAFYRAIALPKWKIWAYSNVRNIHELKRRSQYAWISLESDKAGPGQFEYWTSAQREQWKQIETRFDTADEFIDDQSVPEQLTIYFAWYKKLAILLLSFLTFSFGLVCMYFAVGEKLSFAVVWRIFVAVFFTSMGIWLSYLALLQLFNRKAQIILSEKGIETYKNGFSPWSAIRDINIIAKGTTRHRSFYLQYWAENGLISFELDGLTIGRSKLDKYWRIYRGRYLAANKSYPYGRYKQKTL